LLGIYHIVACTTIDRNSCNSMAAENSGSKWMC
jgi:hypothetical protein